MSERDSGPEHYHERAFDRTSGIRGAGQGADER